MSLTYITLNAAHCWLYSDNKTKINIIILDNNVMFA